MSRFHNIFVRFYDVLWRDPKLIWKYYMPWSQSAGRGAGGRGQEITSPQVGTGRALSAASDSQVVSPSLGGRQGEAAPSIYLFRVDGRVGHGGMFDRLKGLISVYAVAKAQGKPFRILFTYPFRLETYLEPRDYDWRLREGELSERFPKARPVFAYGECYNPVRIMKKRRRQTHFYYGYNSLDKINEHFGTDYDWGRLYHELFRPTPYLQQYLDHYQKEIGSDYIVVHTRFLNLLGDKTETDINPELPVEQRQALMDQIIEKIESLVDGQGMCGLPPTPSEGRGTRAEVDGEATCTKQCKNTQHSTLNTQHYEEQGAGGRGQENTSLQVGTGCALSAATDSQAVSPSLGGGKGEASQVMLASDSMTFIAYAQQRMPEVYVVPGTVKHIDTAGKTDDGENIKMFLDYYLIAGAKKVYNIVGPGMWPSAFPEYAAKIGQTEFERIVLQ